MPRSLDEPNLDDSERKALSDIREHGLHLIHVLPEGDSPGWTYSIGLYHNYRHPEVVVFGLSRSVAHHLINQIGAEVRSGNRYEAGEEYEELLEGVRCAFREVSPIWNYPFFGWTDWFYGDRPYPVVQCIWPDKGQHYPWEEEFPEEWHCAQPLLYADNPRDARASDILASMGLNHEA